MALIDAPDLVEEVKAEYRHRRSGGRPMTWPPALAAILDGQADRDAPLRRDVTADQGAGVLLAPGRRRR